MSAIEAVASHPDLELVGCSVHDEAKVGLDAGALAGIDPIGVAATNDVEALLALDADYVMYSPVMADRKLVVRLDL